MLINLVVLIKYAIFDFSSALPNKIIIPLKMEWLLLASPIRN